ncbi:MAG: autotransporter outer membrane beta-barrel domain-containing protein [Pseudomonadota bacterium]|nr:autotransporter outer membrane beta-barrel domain-containing protein [Pseudomonadota bacterium]QKK05788.1 MAG: autotransporter outer membrane beta-barrel domain-containing protein [Pseudomonadota bacterium]
MNVLYSVLAFLLLAVTAFPGSAKAATINCVGGGNGSGFVVFYDSSAGACTVGNPYQASSTALDDITLFSQDAAAIVHSAANVGTGAGTNNTDHNGCNLQGTAITAGNACSRITGGVNATFTDTMTRTDSMGRTITISANYTIAGFVWTFNNASVTVTGGTGSGTGNTSLNAAASNANTTGTLNNIQNHVDVITGTGMLGGMQSNAVEGQNNASNFMGGGLYSSGSSAAVSSLFSKADDVLGSSRYNYTEGTNDLRSGLVALSPYMNFDTARGDGVTLFGGRMNQTQDAIPDAKTGTTRRSNFAGSNVNLWAYSSFAKVDNERAASAFNGDAFTVTAGGDYKLRSNQLLGLALSYSSIRIDTSFNDGDYDENAYTISPYGIWQVNDWLTVNGALGYTFSNIDQMRAKSTVPVSADTDASTYFASLRARATKQVDDFTLAGKLGYTASHRDIDGFTDSAAVVTASNTSNSSEFRIGGEGGYNYASNGNIFFPFVKADFLLEMSDAINNDPSAFDLGTGFRWFNDEAGLSGSLEGTVQLGRNDYTSWSVDGIIVKSIKSDRFAGMFTPQLTVGLDEGRQKTGLKMDYLHISDAFGVGLDANFYQNTLLFNDEDENGDPITGGDDTEGVVRLHAGLKW